MRALPVASTAGRVTVVNGEVNVGDFLPTHAVDLPTLVRRSRTSGILVPMAGSGAGLHLGGDVSELPAAWRCRVASRTRTEWGIDGAVFVDTVALQSPFSVIGPVTVDGTMT